MLVIRPWLGTVSGADAYAHMDALAMSHTDGQSSFPNRDCRQNRTRGTGWARCGTTQCCSASIDAVKATAATMKNWKGNEGAEYRMANAGDKGTEALKRDKREIFRAASDAQTIADYLLGFHPDYALAAANAGDSFDDDAAASTQPGAAQAA